MEKVIDLNKSVYDITKEYPEVIDVLYELGFKDITKPGMLSTAGRFMTILKGSAMKKIDINVIKKTLSDKGFEVKE